MSKSHTLTARYVRDYRNDKGTKTFVYELTGTPEALAEYKRIQAGHFREDEESGKPLFFTPRPFGVRGTLIITRNGKVIPDLSEFDMANALAAQYGGSLGQSIADAMAQGLVGNLRSRRTSDPGSVPHVNDTREEDTLTQTPPPNGESDLGDLG